MLLAVDIGNSTVSIGVIKSGRIIADFKFPTDKALKFTACNELIRQMLDRENIKGGAELAEV